MRQENFEFEATWACIGKILVSEKQWKEGKEGGIEEGAGGMTKGESGRGEHSTQLSLDGKALLTLNSSTQEADVLGQPGPSQSAEAA